MKTKIVIFAALAAFGLEAQTVLETTYADGSTNKWTQTDLTDALGLMNRKYHREIQTESGRRAWHGKKVGQYLLTNEQTRVIYVASLYEDGFVWQAAAKPVRPSDPEAAAKAQAEARAKAEALKAAFEAAHLPPEIAALRQAQRDAAKTNTLTVTVSP